VKILKRITFKRMALKPNAPVMMTREMRLKEDEHLEVLLALDDRRVHLMGLKEQEDFQPYAVRHLTLVHRLMRKHQRRNY
jgi:hypothetical protein